jgi:hypothetical protein
MWSLAGWVKCGLIFIMKKDGLVDFGWLELKMTPCGPVEMTPGKFGR